jgi:hypothetical protein
MTDNDVQAMLGELRRAAKLRPRQHRHPAAAFHPLVSVPEQLETLTAAAERLLAGSNDAQELELVAHLQLRPNAELYRTLLARLAASESLPASSGLRTGTLIGDLREHLIDWLPAHEPALARAAQELLQREGSIEQQLSLALRIPDVDAIVDRLAKFDCKPTHDAYLRTLALTRLAELAPDRVIAAAQPLAGLDEAERRRILAGLEQAAASWMDQHRKQLEAALRL